MRRAGHLFEQVVGFFSLVAAARRAARGKRLSHAAAAFLMDLEPEVLRLQRELLDGTYRPRPYTTFEIQDPKPRTISAAAFRDRVVHHSLCAALEPIFERYAIFDSYACRKGKGTLAALERARHFTRRFAWFLKLDVRKFFETADWEVLSKLMARLIKDRRVLDLAALFIEAGTPGSPPGKGLPIGNLTSQHFANLYLGPLDHFVKEELRVKGYLRYMDDALLLADTKQELRAWKERVEEFLAEGLRLELRDEVTVLAPVSDGVPFLGFRIWPGVVRLDPRRARRFRRRFRTLHTLAREGIIDEDELARRASSLVGWAQQADTRNFRASFFDRLEWEPWS